MYTVQFINPLDQFGSTSFDLIMTDSSGVFPDYRSNIQVSSPAQQYILESLANMILAQINYTYANNWIADPDIPSVTTPPIATIGYTTINMPGA